MDVRRSKEAYQESKKIRLQGSKDNKDHFIVMQKDGEIRNLENFFVISVL